uniref:Heat shock 70 kDa protein 13 (Trinotate prediction) n=1 Tax=Myxobolus squamalis TaxID=59785 RepID=A0A6B2FWB7_MYXSQ
MISAGTFSVVAVIMAILCYFLRIYFPYPPPTVIGIDLGTTFSSLAIFNNGFGNVSIITDEKNKTLIPSIVTFYQNGSIAVGKRANLSEHQQHETFYDSKRFIGRNDLNQHKIPPYPFPFEIHNGTLFYLLPKNFTNKKFKSNLIEPFQLSFLIIEHIKAIFKNKFGYNPSKAVIGVPVEFDQKQRNATLEAAKMAGIEVLRLVNEPTAASVAADVHNRQDVENVAVLDLGGGTFDVAILSSIERTLNTLSIAGNDRLGGRDFTNQFSNCINRKTDNNTDFFNSEYQEFLDIVETAKIQLSTETSVRVLFKKNGKLWDFTMTLAEFEECNSEVFLL